MGAVEIILDVILLAVCAFCAVTDLRKHLIYDWVTLPALGVALVLRFSAFGMGGFFDAGLVSAIFGAGFCLLVFGLFMIWGKGMGGGDVKLMVAVGALAGFRFVLTISMCTALVGAVLGLVLLVSKRKLLAGSNQLMRETFVTKVGLEERVTLPYGLPIALGAIWSLLIKYGVLGGF